MRHVITRGRAFETLHACIYCTYECAQKTTISIRDHGENPYRKETPRRAFFSFRDSPHKPSVGAFTLAPYTESGLL